MPNPSGIIQRANVGRLFYTFLITGIQASTLPQFLRQLLLRLVPPGVQEVWATEPAAALDRFMSQRCSTFVVDIASGTHEQR